MSIPQNIIIAWSGSTTNIPAGWLLCDGTNNTPDLRNRFIVGAGNTYSLNDTGGNADATLVDHTHTVLSISEETVSHNHGVGANGSGSSNVASPTTGRQGSTAVTSNSAGNHSHNLTTSTTGESGTGKNLPPYYALAFIMYGGE